MKNQELCWMSCQVDADLDQAVRNLAARLRISRSELQRQAVVKFIEQHENAGQVGRVSQAQPTSPATL